MVNSIFITNSGISTGTGGGNVGYNIVEALHSCTEVKLILCNQRFPDNKYQNIDAFSINPGDYGYSNVDPFFMDYMAYHHLPEDPIELAMFYSDPFGLTAEKLKRDYFCKVVCDLAPHNIEISKEEHMKFIGKYPFPHLTNDYLWKLHSRHLRIADKVIVHSKKSAEYIKDKAELKETPVVIPHGCSLPIRIEPLPSRFTVGHLGGGIDKGILYLLLAWKKLNPNNMDLLIAGSGTELWNKFIEDNKIPNVKVLGRIDDIDEFYNKCSIYVQSSVSEGFGIPCLESMAHGRPVIATNETGASDLIRDGETGFVIGIRDPDAIVEKLLYYINNIGEVERIGKNARRKAENYSWERIRQKYSETFRELL